jgi:peptidoglycan/xylan/chitin deacetylase (PgdA/CDA1 family)
VDWRRQGAPLEHIEARKHRFDKEILENARVENPYYNIPAYMDIEDAFGIRSTFFFRTHYENGDYTDYAQDIKRLIAYGWEIGLHLDPYSINDSNKIREEVVKLKKITNATVRGIRVHYLAFSNNLLRMIPELGFVYDSSIKKNKEKITNDDMGYYKHDKVIEFPITLMDAYIFSFIRVAENQLISLFKTTLDYGRKLSNDFNIITVIWHDNVLRMKGGRMYKEILQFLTSQKDVTICRGIDLVELINSKWHLESESPN